MDYDYTAIFKASYKNGDTESLEQAITNMKIFGASQIACVQVVRQQLDLSLNEANAMVQRSRAWLP